MTVTINGTTGIDKIQDGIITSADFASSVPLGTKNLIINGAMQIAQRATSASGLTGSGYHTIDRFHTSLGTAGTWTMSQDTDVPSGQGFASSLKYACTTANASLSAGSVFAYNTRFEGQHLQHLKYGTSSAESMTLSFWVKSNKTGTYIAELYSSDSSKQISKSYTIDTADTWEKKTITYAGDTASGFDNDSNNSLTLYMWLSAGTDFTSGTLNTSWASSTNANRTVGQVNLADSTSNYINITGLQLEIGSTATPFEHLSWEEQLRRCMRYYEKSYNYTRAIGSATGEGICSYIVMAQSTTSLANNGTNGVNFKVPKRANPTMTVYDYDGNSGQLSVSRNGSPRANYTAVVHRQGEYTCGVYTTSASGMTAGYAVEQHHHWTADSEL